MCGIAGYINRDLKNVQDTQKICQMLAVQKHRGPDDTGITAFSLISGRLSEMSTVNPMQSEPGMEGMLGFNRLSILDLSPKGHQPMISPDQKVIMVMNGEIYNAFNYKDELSKWGYCFKSTSDTEIVLALYLKYGFEQTLAKLNGMFSLVFIDLLQKTIFIARDRFGIKPIYYLVREDIFAFSSELKSFKFLDNFSFRLNEDQLDEYLLFRSNVTSTLVKDIEFIKPGHFITYSHQNGLTIRKYFNINEYSRHSTLHQDLNYYTEGFQDHLKRSVNAQLMSDVRVGCQLSGGIDSSLVTWFANSDRNSESFEAVSIIFDEERFNEERYIDKVTQKLNIPNHKFLLDPNYYADNIEKSTWHLETPLNHPNTVAIYYLCQQAKNHVTVLLSGEGADEIFGGYERFLDIKYPYTSRRLLHEIKRNINTPSAICNYFHHEWRAVMATAYMLPSLAALLKAGFSNEKATDYRLELYRSLSGSLFNRQVKYEILTYLPDLLTRQDKMSMAHSIENRVPFLDNEVVEYSFCIPEKYLAVRGSPEGCHHEKYLLKKIAAKIFGDDFAFRDKMGFGIPLREFLANESFNEYLKCKILPGIRERSIFDHKIVANWLKNISKLRYFELESLWEMVAFEIWASIYLDNSYENCDTSF